MKESARQHERARTGSRAWIRAAIFAGAAYFVVGRGFAAPVEQSRAWRLGAWVLSGVVFAAHLGYEHFKVRHSPRVSASHTAFAVALGAFLLAMAGAVHSLAIGSGSWSAWMLALVAWPTITAVPAFVAALVVALVLAPRSRRADSE